jgi:NAD(P)-dependent dehydrogenase (short-subunit alcohol dehydrogenase family)
MSLDLQLKSRRALVTGGTRGVGKAVVETLHGAGARVVATARSLPAQPAEGVHYVAARHRPNRLSRRQTEDLTPPPCSPRKLQANFYANYKS